MEQERHQGRELRLACPLVGWSWEPAEPGRVSALLQMRDEQPELSASREGPQGPEPEERSCFHAGPSAPSLALAGDGERPLALLLEALQQPLCRRAAELVFKGAGERALPAAAGPLRGAGPGGERRGHKRRNKGKVAVCRAKPLICGA